MRNRSIINRINNLENQVTEGDHEYTANIGWDNEDCHYYKDGVEISQAQYFREAPKNQPIEIEFTEMIPVWPNKANPELWHQEAGKSDNPISWDQVQKQHPGVKIKNMEGKA